MAIVAFCGQKGGSGKTTAAIAFAAECQARGFMVLVVDGDAQGTARTWADVAAQNGHPAPEVVAMGADLYRADRLPALAKGFDLVIIDCPPRHAEVQRAALMVADVAVLPSGPSAPDIWSLSESVELVRTARQMRPALRAAALVTRKVPGTVIGRGVREALEVAGLAVLKAELGFRVSFQEFPAAGLGPTQYEPNSEAAEEVRALTTELLGLARITKRRK
jgi:chromosome partitioning protein